MVKVKQEPTLRSGTDTDRQVVHGVFEKGGRVAPAGERELRTKG
jgi:hypothetical protein